MTEGSMAGGGMARSGAADAGAGSPVGGRQALVLCGGLGTRLREAVPDRPKAMAPIRGKPFLEILLRSLERRGVRDIVLATGHLGGQIEDYFGDGGCWDLAIRYSREREPLGTGGAVKLAEPLLRDRFLILNGDTFVDFDPAALEARMDAAGASLVLALRRVDDASRYGAVDVDADGRVRAFVEKGARGGPFINAGVYLAAKEALGLLDAGRAVSLEREWMPRLLERSRPEAAGRSRPGAASPGKTGAGAGGVYGVESGGIFIDIGIPEDFARAQDLLRIEAGGDAAGADAAGEAAPGGNA